MTALIVALALSASVVVYAYLLYPVALILLRLFRRAPAVISTAPREWPRISITLPAYNAQETLRPVLDGLVRADYPADRRQILVVSDGSTDGTDALVREYATQGVELLRIEGRLGKTEIENRAMGALTGEIIVNTDASVTVRPDAIKKLVSALGDPRVGAVSGRAVSIASVGAMGEASEGAYVDYEMWIRDLETAVEGIIGSSGCLYAVRAGLHRRELPGHLSRDFSSALWARLNGFRTVSVRDAICFVPPTANMRVEYRRKIRTMSRGIQTLFHHARLLNPFRYGMFAVLLYSHKLVRWMVPVALLVGGIALVGIAATANGVNSSAALWAWAAVASMLAGFGLAAVGWWWPGERAPKLGAMAAFFVSGTVAGLIAWKRALSDQRAPVWEPTPRVLAVD